jgi:parvulin-like peptidyl-prolyl isomerase
MALSRTVIRLTFLMVLLLVGCTTSPSATSPAPQPTPSSGETMSPAEPSPPPTPERPLAARVNGQPIYLVDYERQVAQYEAAMIARGEDPSSPEGQAQLMQAREQILNWMIERVLVEQAAAQQGITVTDAEIEAAMAQMIQDAGSEEAFQARLEQNGLTQQEMWNELRAELIGQKVIEQVIAAVPETAEHVHARHILVATQQQAEQLLAQIQAGGDFAALARQYSQDESTRDAGGDLGFFPRGVLMVPEVEETAFSLQPGQTSGVVQSSFGYHIIQVTERELNYPLSPENLQLLRDRAYQEWSEALWSQAQIERYVGQNS